MPQPPRDTFSLADVLTAVKVLQGNNVPPGPSGHYELHRHGFVHPRSIAAFMQQRRDRGDAYMRRVIAAMRDDEGPFDAEARLQADDDFIAAHGVRAWYLRATRRALPPRGGPPPA